MDRIVQAILLFGIFAMLAMGSVFYILSIVKVRKSLGEVLATLVAAAIPSAFFQHPGARVGVLVICLTCGFLGATHAWQRLEAADCKRPRFRYAFVAACWFLFPALFAAMIGPVIAVGAAAGLVLDPLRHDRLDYILAILGGMTAVLPGLLIYQMDEYLLKHTPQPLDADDL